MTSHGSGGRKSKFRPSAGLASPEASLLGLEVAIFPLSPTWSPLSACLCYLFLQGHQSDWSSICSDDLLGPSSPLQRCYLQAKAHSETWGAGTSTYEFGKAHEPITLNTSIMYPQGKFGLTASWVAFPGEQTLERWRMASRG